MPSIGALTRGHVLVCPKPHVRSFAAAPSTLDAALASLADGVAATLLRSLGLPVHRFEHGSSMYGARVACSVEHAHLHMVPSQLDVMPAMSGLAAWQRVGPGPQGLRKAIGTAEYLFYESPDGERLAAPAPAGGFPSQLLRRLFADEAGEHETWNWRRHPAREKVQATVSLFVESQRHELATVHA
jgi:diadenosine tetraphosphate (Ap4A) HIT family hydrolase